MKNHLSILCFALVFFQLGCQPQSETPAPASAVPKEAPKPTASSTPTGQKDVPKPVDTATKAQPGDIAARIYQLRDLAKITISAPSRPINLWIMNNESKEAEGMMFLTEKEVKDDEGMIFVFPDSAPRSFWMQNTLLPLDIAYIDPKGKVLNIAEGKPKDVSALPSAGDAQYVIELKKGQAEKSGIKPGTILQIPQSLKSEG